LMAGEGYPMIASHDPNMIKIAGQLAQWNGRKRARTGSFRRNVRTPPVLSAETFLDRLERGVFAFRTWISVGHSRVGGTSTCGVVWPVRSVAADEHPSSSPTPRPPCRPASSQR
ncbi:hypothetical protein AB0E96_29920, partial [Kitasatospora sp. NPDC036755]